MDVQQFPPALQIGNAQIGTRVQTISKPELAQIQIIAEQQQTNQQLRKFAPLLVLQTGNVLTGILVLLAAGKPELAQIQIIAEQLNQKQLDSVHALQIGNVSNGALV